LKVALLVSAIILFGVVGLNISSKTKTNKRKEFADTIYTNGKIYTVNAGQPWADALAINDGVFIAFGSDKDIRASFEENTKTGNPTGWLKEAAAGKWAWKHYPQVFAENHKKGLQSTIAYLNSIGVTSVKQQHAKNPISTAAKSLEKDNNLNIRLGLSWTWKGPLEPMPLKEQEQMIAKLERFASQLIKTDYVKLSADGKAGSTGYVLKPYLLTGDKGIAFYTDDALFAEVEKFDRMGMGITIHATGDAANRQMIDAVDRVKRKYGTLKARHQLGHASMLHPDDIERLKALDLTAEFSPVVWFTADFVKAQIPQIGTERMRYWYPMKSEAEKGGRFVIASDGPLMWQENFPRLESAITRAAPTGVTQPLARIRLSTWQQQSEL